MILLSLITALTIFLFAGFTLTYRLQTINRAIINTPIELFETSIPLANVDEENLYFDKKRLETKVTDYYSSSIGPYFKSYDVSFYYYNQTDKSICVSDTCNAVEITITGNYFLSFEYERTINYEIHKGAKYGQ